MKPHLLMLLLLAIPPLLANILACENAEKSDAPPAAKSDSLTRDLPPIANPRAPAATAPATPPTKPATSTGSGGGTATGLKAWNVM